MHFYRRLPTISAMTFDLDDTLYDNHPVIVRVEQEVLAWLLRHYPLCQSLPVPQWHQIKRQLAHDEPMLCHDVSLWRWKQIVAGLELAGYSNREAKHAADGAMEQMHHWRNLVEVPEQSHRVLAALSQAMPLIAITNGNVDPDKIGLSQYFTHVFRAGVDGRLKPYPDMFLAAQRQLKLPLANILHVGDHLRTDVLGAKRCGMSACWIHDGNEDLGRASVLPDVEVDDLSQLLNFIP